KGLVNKNDEDKVEVDIVEISDDDDFDEGSFRDQLDAALDMLESFLDEEDAITSLLRYIDEGYSPLESANIILGGHETKKLLGDDKLGAYASGGTVSPGLGWELWKTIMGGPVSAYYDSQNVPPVSAPSGIVVPSTSSPASSVDVSELLY